MVLRVLLALALLVSAAGAPLWAVEPDERLKDPALEARARALSKNLRCLVCQNQSIDESDAPLAKELRLVLRERLRAGDSDEQAKNFIVSSYGEFVLLRPVFAWHTLALWLGPFMVLLIAIALIARRRGQMQTRPVAQLTDKEQRDLEALLRDAKD